MACVTKRRGKWVVDYTIFGDRKTPSFSSKSEAEAFKRELLLRDIDNSIGFKKIETRSVNEVVEQYLQTVTTKKEIRTHEVDKLALENFKKRFESCSVQDIQLQHLESYQIFLLQQGLKASSVNRKFNVIRNFFRKCVDWKYCSENPTLNLTKLKEEPVVRTPFKVDEIIKIIDGLPIWAARAFLFAAKTGVRRGGICLLTWDCVDFESKSIKVVSKKGGKIAKVVDLPMTDDIQELMLSLKNEQVAKPSNFVFLNANGSKIIPSTLTRKVIQVSKKLGLEGAGLHLARHTVLTELSSLNQSGSIIQRVAGHSSLNTSQKYLHHSSNEVREALQKLEAERPLIKAPLRLVSVGS